MKVSECLQYLAETDDEYGQLKGCVAGLEYLIKVAESEGFLAAQGTVGECQAKARSSEKYKSAVENYTDAKIEMETIAAKRKTAELTIDVYRTQQASKRQGIIQ